MEEKFNVNALVSSVSFMTRFDLNALIKDGHIEPDCDITRTELKRIYYEHHGGEKNG